MPHPFQGPSPARVPLVNAPLVRVLAVVRFPELASMARDEFVAPFQEALRASYPVGEKQETVGFAVGAQGAQALPASFDWRLYDLDGHWVASLGRNFVGLETTRYTSREDFLGRFEQVLAAATTHVRPGVRERIGVRYIDQVHGEPLGRIAELIRPALLGLLATDFAADVRVGISDYSLSDEKKRVIRVRSGKLPVGATIDPIAVPAIDVPSWILDIDAARVEHAPWNAAEILSEAGELADRAHRVFRWAVTPEFIRTFGGTP